MKIFILIAWSYINSNFLYATGDTLDNNSQTTDILSSKRPYKTQPLPSKIQNTQMIVGDSESSEEENNNIFLRLLRGEVSEEQIDNLKFEKLDKESKHFISNLRDGDIIAQVLYLMNQKIIVLNEKDNFSINDYQKLIDYFKEIKLSVSLTK